jgi:hypothetical protein
VTPEELDDEGRCPRCLQQVADPARCPSAPTGCDGIGEFLDLSEFVDVPDDRLARDKPAPVLCPDDGPATPWQRLLQLLYASHATLGVDEHGKPTWAEQATFLDEHGVVDPWERRLWQHFWAAITAAESVERARRMESLAQPDETDGGKTPAPRRR